MKVLLDTHVVLWALEDPALLSRDMIDLLEARPRASLAVSVASLWEIAIKMAKGKLRAPDNLPELLARDGFDLLPVTPKHAWAVKDVPRNLSQKDPFDRLIFTQAKLDGFVLATRDEALLRSGLDVVSA